MVLPPPEKSPVVLLQWTPQAQENEMVRSLVQQEIRANRMIVVPTSAVDTLLLTASQESLEEQAEKDHLVKPRRIVAGLADPKAAAVTEIVMDHFSRKNKSQFANHDEANTEALDEEGLFSVHERCHLVLGLLDRISVSDPKLLAILIGEESNANETTSSQNLRYLLQKQGWIDVLTPLHVDDIKARVQADTWFPIWQMMPPVDAIDQYYGPSVAYYFAFVGFLGRWLGALGVLGLSSYLFRVYRNDTIDEDEYTPFYGLMCFLWSILLIRFWERMEHKLAYRWGTMEISNPGVVDEFEQDFSVAGGSLLAHRRPEFTGYKRTSPVTGQPELYFPPWRRKLQYLVSGLVTAAMLAVAFSVMILSLNLQGYIRPKSQYHPFYFAQFAILSEEGAWFDAKSDWKCFIPVILHCVSILTLNTIYRMVAGKLTDWENHETQTSHDNSLILKRFLFEAFDCYIVLFYLAFYERDVDRLRVELVAVFNIDSFRRLGTEVILPYALHYFDPKDDDEAHPHDLHLDEYEPFDDYMEVLIQFGYVTLFASAYPLASLLMAAAMWLEMRSDMYKLTNLCQKPVARERMHEIGVWKKIFQFMVWFSCLTNCMLFGYTSNQMMHYMPQFYIEDDEGLTHMVHDKGWIAILIIFGLERTLLFLGLLMYAMIPALPESLVVQLKRRQFLLAQQSKKSD